mgnify:CR=1 FL=1
MRVRARLSCLVVWALALAPVRSPRLVVVAWWPETVPASLTMPPTHAVVTVVAALTMTGVAWPLGTMIGRVARQVAARARCAPLCA